MVAFDVALSNADSERSVLRAEIVYDDENAGEWETGGEGHTALHIIGHHLGLPSAVRLRPCQSHRLAEALVATILQQNP